MRKIFLSCSFFGLLAISSMSLPVSTWAGGGANPLYVRAGTSASYTDPSGNVWIGDADYSGGTEYATTHAISKTTTQPLYQAERYGNSTYTFSGLPAGVPYAVTLKFSEDYWTAAGQRIFNVFLNGATVLSNFDIFADSGGEYIADDKTFNTTVNSSGQIVIQFQNGSQTMPRLTRFNWSRPQRRRPSSALDRKHSRVRYRFPSATRTPQQRFTTPRTTAHLRRGWEPRKSIAHPST